MLFGEVDRIYARADKALEEGNLTQNRELWLEVLVCSPLISLMESLAAFTFFVKKN